MTIATPAGRVLHALFALLVCAVLGMGTASARENFLDNRTIGDLATEYYNTRSEWAGTFSIVSVQRVRVEHQGPRLKEVHIAYTYAPIPGNRAGRRDRGQDQRIFTFQKHQGNWIITNMGGHMSAWF